MGCLIVAAHGDDISFPDRTELTWQVWQRSRGKAASVMMGFVSFSDDASIPAREVPTPLIDLAAVIRRAGACVVGASYAWHKRVFETFGPLPNYLHIEDIHIPFRSLLLGGIAFDPTPVCKYRQHIGNYLSPYHPDYRTPRGQQVWYQKKLTRHLAELRGFGEVLNKAVELGILSRDEFSKHLVLISKMSAQHQFQLDLMSPNLRHRLAAAVGLWRPGTFSDYSKKRKLFYLLASVSPSLGRLLYRFRVSHQTGERSRNSRD